MNKQELLNKLHEQYNEYFKYSHEKGIGEEEKTHAKGVYSGFRRSMILARELDETSLEVKVPQFVADWLDNNARFIHIEQLVEEVADATDTFDNFNKKMWRFSYEFYYWLRANSYIPILVDAQRYGYEAIEESLYYVALPKTGNNRKPRYLYFNEVRKFYSTIGNLDNDYIERHKYKFTEKEIKDLDERYWAFAVPVEDGDE